MPLAASFSAGARGIVTYSPTPLLLSLFFCWKRGSAQLLLLDHAAKTEQLSLPICQTGVVESCGQFRSGKRA